MMKENKQKTANKKQILNRQFQFVFTQDDGNDISELGGPNYPHINNLTIIVNRVETIKTIREIT